MEQFGGKVRKKDLEKLKQSKHWKNGKFENLIETKMDMSLGKIPKLLKDNIKGRSIRIPKSNLPILPLDLEKLENKTGEPSFVWYGHSVCLLRVNGKNLLIDPMLGPDAAPIAPISSKRFSANSLDVIDELPEIDAVLMTHDHYDHLDLDSIKKLKPKVKTWFVGLGISRHLEKWKIPADQITEFDWWDNIEFEGIQITYTPSRHFSGRGAFDRAKSLWGGWVFKTSDYSIYWSGDGGYGPHFKDIGEKLGPFDFGFMECGQYNENWHAIHMYPEESVKAALDARVKKVIAVHWAGFSLALHHWKEPIERFIKEAEVLGLELSTPKLGEALTITDISKEFWWENIN
jgi:L-ascorbate metabolism protein UlaG (beta-lactamase superfamily)